MPHRDPHPHRSDPVSTFDTWLDAFVAGTPAEAPQDNPSGTLAMAQTGARQLHGLAARGATAPAAARQRIREELMHSGALAATGGGRTWIPESGEKRAPWWSPASPVIPTALAFAVIVALVASLVWTQRPASSPDPTDAPGFAVSSPGATPAGGEVACGAPGYRPVVYGEVDAEALAMLGGEPIVRNGATTITAANGEEITFDEDTVWTPYPGLGSDLIVSGDTSEELDTYTSLATGQSWTFPAQTTGSAQSEPSVLHFGPWLMGASEPGGNWTIINTETGEERLVADILGNARNGSGVAPMQGPWAFGSGVARIIPFLAGDGPTPVLVLPSGDLDDAYPIEPEHVLAGGNSVISEDGSLIAYVSLDDDVSTIRVLDGFTGELIAEHLAPEARDVLQVVGLTADDAKLVLRDSQQVWTVDLAGGEIAPLFDPDVVVYAFELDRTTGTALASYGDDRPEHHVWVDPTTGVMKPLDLDGLVRPYPQFGWALLQSRADSGIDYTLLDMATGEIVTESVSVGRGENGSNVWIIGGSPDSAGVYVVRGVPGRILVLDGPSGRAFELSTPEDGRSDWNGVAIGISPNNECIVYTRTGEGDENGTSWIAPLEPDAEWTRLPFEVSGWLELPTDTTQTLPAQDLATPLATPEPIAGLGGVLIIEGSAEQARIEGDMRVAVRHGDTLTLPLPSGEVVTIPGITGLDWRLIDGEVVAHREGQPPAVLDLSTGEFGRELPETPGFQPWSQGWGRWDVGPVDDTLTDWIITDRVTGETRLLSELVDLPDGQPVLPVPTMPYRADDTQVFAIQQGEPVDRRWVPTGAPVGSVLISGKHAIPLPDFPTAADDTGSPLLVTGADGRIVAFETRAGDDRIVIIDTASGEELARYGVDAVGQDPTLAGFLGDAATLVVTSEHRVLFLRTDGEGVQVVREGLDGIANPLLHPDEAVLWFTQGGAVMHLNLPGNDQTEVANGFVPGALSFTRPEGSDWVYFQTQEGVTLAEAASGEIVSQMKLPGARGGFPEVHEIAPWWTDADGDTTIIGMERQGRGPSGVPGKVWLLSPDHPDGLEVTGPSDELPLGDAYLSPDGTTLFASARGQTDSHGELWSTPLGEEPAWELIAEDVSVVTILPPEDAATGDT